MPKRRLGVVLLVPPPVAAEVDGLRRAVGDGALGRIPPHLTLVPPVNVREDRLGDALRVLREAAAATRPFRVGLGPPATFLPANPTLYLDVQDPDGAVTGLRARVFRDPLERSLTFPFVPHVTIADGADPDRIAASLTVLADYTTEVTFDRVHLLEERPDRVWEAIAEAPFRAAAVIGRGGLPLELTVTTTLDAEASAFQDAEWGAYARASYGDDAAPDVPMAVTARRDGRIVGIAAGQVTGDMAYLANLITAAYVRNQGVGAALLAAFESEAAARGCVRLTLRTQADGPARQFYERHGWVELHPLPGWRHGRDFVQMERRLT